MLLTKPNDELWVYDYEPEILDQLSQWKKPIRHQGNPREYNEAAAQCPNKKEFSNEKTTPNKMYCFRKSLLQSRC